MVVKRIRAKAEAVEGSRKTHKDGLGLSLASASRCMSLSEVCLSFIILGLSIILVNANALSLYFVRK